MDYYDFELVFSSSVGAIFAPCEPELFARLRTMKLPGREARTHVGVWGLQRGGQWKYYEAAPEESAVRKGVIDPLRAIGVLEKGPLLESVSDTSDTGSSLTVSVRLMDQCAGFGVSMMHSGFTGEHSWTVRSALESVLQLAGYDGDRPLALVASFDEMERKPVR